MSHAQFCPGVYRRLLVLSACIALAAVQPILAAPAAGSTEPQRSPETVIYPKAAAEKNAEPAIFHSDSGPGGSAYLLVVVLLGAAGVWLLWKRKAGQPLFANKGDRKLFIEETRSLGNRQHLVVASYEGKKFLIGVTQERIELLTHLPDDGGLEQ